MALRPLSGVRRGRRSAPMPFVAPVGGLNARDALASMPAEDAIVLDNWFPTTDGVETRKGHIPWATTLGGPVKSLAAYNGATTRKLLGFADGEIWDATANAAAVSLAAGRSNDEVQTTMFVNAGDHWLIGGNGVDAPFSYNGAAVSNLVITGVTGGQEKLVYPFSFKGRMYWAAVGQAGFYYLGVGNIQGAASYFDLGQVASQGGTLRAIASITKDSGEGPDDFIVFIMDTGEYIVYAGYDPTDILNWSLVGRFFVAPPIGKRPVQKYGGDSLVVTQLGIISLLKLFDGEQFNPDKDTISWKLGTALAFHRQFESSFGWQMAVHPFANQLILNVPASTSLGTFYQFVMNTKTNAWCRFVGMDAICWAVLEGEVYFGDFSGTVHKADEGYDDNGADIRVDAIQAYSRFNELMLKQFHFARLITSFSAGIPAITIRFNTDFKAIAPPYGLSSIGGGGSLWDISTWDLAEWSGEGEVQYFSQDIGAIGFAGSIWVRASVSGDQIRWFATEYIYEKGGLIGG